MQQILLCCVQEEEQGVFAFFSQTNPNLQKVISALPPPTEAAMHEAAPKTCLNYQI